MNDEVKKPKNPVTVQRWRTGLQWKHGIKGVGAHSVMLSDKDASMTQPSNGPGL
jgi:hypothetical protein